MLKVAAVGYVEDGGSSLCQSTRCNSPDDTVQSHRRKNHELRAKFLTLFF